MIARIAAATLAAAALWLNPAVASAAQAPARLPVASFAVELAADPDFRSVNAEGPGPWQCGGSVEADGPAIGSEFTQVIGEQDGARPGLLPLLPVEPASELVGTPPSACGQVVPVQPGATYRLSVTFTGGPAVLGVVPVEGAAYQAVNSPGGTRSRDVTIPFTAAAGRSTVTIVVHGGVAGDEPFHAAAVSLIGPASTVQAPEPPTALHTDRRTSRTALLSWRAAPGATSYRVLRDGEPLETTTETSAVVTGLTAGGQAALTVTALNPAGESAASAPATVGPLPAYGSVPDQPAITVTPGRYVGTALVEITPTTGMTDGYRVYVDGVLAGWMYETRADITDLTDGEHHVTVTALNVVGESAPSDVATVVLGS